VDQFQPYQDFTFKEFICDEYFQDWILHPDPQRDLFWKNWILLHPDQEEPISKAAELLKSIQFAEYRPTEQQVRESLEKILARMGPDEAKETYFLRVGIRHIGRWGKAAAILTGILLAGLLYFFLKRSPAELSLATAFGKLDTAELPDHSRVVLNANSKITYYKDWSRKKPREVWLEGEAFFDVVHLNTGTENPAPYDLFYVHTPVLTVEVLGTSFDIRVRRGKTEIVLESGRIKITLNNQEQQGYELTPGEKITYDASSGLLIRSKTDPANYSAWKDKKLVLVNARLSEIIAYLEDNYGKKVLLQDPLLANRTIGGEVDLDSLQDALFILSKTLDLEIVETDSTLVFKSR
jgi:transmembrane sensor